MASVHYTKDHEWIRVDGTVGTVGITDYAQKQLGDIVFVELPNIGLVIQQGNEVAVVESVKAASEVFAPVSGEVIAVNEELLEDPGRINNDPNGGGWFFQMTLADPNELTGLLDTDSYDAYVKTLQ